MHSPPIPAPGRLPPLLPWPLPTSAHAFSSPRLLSPWSCSAAASASAHASSSSRTFSPWSCSISLWHRFHLPYYEFNEIACSGHSSTHVLHSTHVSALTCALSFTLITSTGHSSAQVPHPVHSKCYLTRCAWWRAVHNKGFHSQYLFLSSDGTVADDEMSLIFSSSAARISDS